MRVDIRKAAKQNAGNPDCTNMSGKFSSCPSQAGAMQVISNALVNAAVACKVP